MIFQENSFRQTDKPAGFSPDRFFPKSLTLFSTTSTGLNLPSPGSTPTILYPVISYNFSLSMLGALASDSFLGLEGGALLPKWPFPEFERLF